METIDISVPSGSDDAIVRAVEDSAAQVGLTVTLRTTTSTYPGSVHWHFKKPDERRGTLELTYWPKNKRLWAKIQSGRKADWIHASLKQLASAVAGKAKSKVGKRK